MPLPVGYNHLGSVSVDPLPLEPYANEAISAVLWYPVAGPCIFALFAVENTAAATTYLQVYDAGVLVQTYPVPAKGIVYEHPEIKVKHQLGLALSTSSSTLVAPASAGVLSIGVQSWVSGNLPS